MKTWKRGLAFATSFAMALTAVSSSYCFVYADEYAQKFTEEADPYSEDISEETLNESNTEFVDSTAETTSSGATDSEDESDSNNTNDDITIDDEFSDGNETEKIMDESIQSGDFSDENQFFISDFSSEPVELDTAGSERTLNDSTTSENIALNLSETRKITISRNMQDPGINFVSSDSSVVSTSGSGYDFNTDSYPWTKDCYCTIKGVKKGNATVSVIDANGETVKVYKVTVNAYNYSACPGEEFTVSLSAYKDQNYSFSSPTTSVNAKLTSYGSSSFNGFSTYWKKYQISIGSEGIHDITATGLVSGDTTTYTVNASHEWDNKYSVKYDSTCTKEGKESIHCIKCNAEKPDSIRSIAAKGHTKVIDPAVSPTCENAGKTEGSHCSACGEVIVAQNTIPATGHSWDNGTVTQEPTCDNTGTKTYTCATCGKTQTETINALGHKEVIDPAVSATCETDGKTEGIHCSTCGKVLIPQNVIPATGHSWDDGTITQNASCENTGIKTYTCTTCSKTKIEDIAATGHSWDNGKITKEASCTEPGVKTFTCTTCKKTKTENIAATGHSWNNGKITKEASCTEPGVKTYTCTNCQETKVENINAAGHKFSSWKISSPATVFALEKQVRTCSTCGKEEQKEVGSKLQKTMKISATSVTLKVKQKTTALKVTGLAEGDSIISWKSNNTKIATISGKPDGTCTIKAGKKTGKAKITITLKSGLQKTVTVSVQKSTVKTKKITGIAKSLKLKKKQKTVLHPVIAPFTSTEKVTYKSSNSKVATVNSKGQITAKKKGTSTITVKSGSKSVKCKVTVK